MHCKNTVTTFHLFFRVIISPLLYIFAPFHIYLKFWNCDKIHNFFPSFPSFVRTFFFLLSMDWPLNSSNYQLKSSSTWPYANKIKTNIKLFLNYYHLHKALIYLEYYFAWTKNHQSNHLFLKWIAMIGKGKQSSKVTQFCFFSMAWFNDSLWLSKCLLIIYWLLFNHAFPSFYIVSLWSPSLHFGSYKLEKANVFLKLFYPCLHRQSRSDQTWS